MIPVAFISVATTAASARLVALVSVAAKAVNRLLVTLRNRREIAMLMEADSSVLRDLGLTRNDVSAALDEPMWRDPSARLLVWSIERRAAARAAVRDNLHGLGHPEETAVGRAA